MTLRLFDHKKPELRPKGDQ